MSRINDNEQETSQNNKIAIQLLTYIISRFHLYLFMLVCKVGFVGLLSIKIFSSE